jgi:hypothetical protein
MVAASVLKACSSDVNLCNFEEQSKSRYSSRSIACLKSRKGLSGVAEHQPRSAIERGLVTARRGLQKRTYKGCGLKQFPKWEYDFAFLGERLFLGVDRSKATNLQRGLD